MSSKLRLAFDDATTLPRPSASKEVAKPYCIRLKPSEKARIEELAGDQTVSAFVRERCLGNEVAPRRRVKRYQPDHEVAAKLLAALGRSRIASNLNQIAKAMNLGAVPVDDELKADIAEACAAVVRMRRDSIVALGIKVQD
mgnify:CR=1 FL=1